MKKHLYTFLFSIIVAFAFSQAPVLNAIVGSSVVCANSLTQNSYSVSATNSPTYYLWSYDSNSYNAIIYSDSSSVASLSFPNANETYTISCVAINAFGVSSTEHFVVTVFESLNVSFSGANTFCQGSSTNLSASSTIQGASTTALYNWLPSYGLNTTTSSDVIANPSVPTTYTVTAQKGGCSNTAQITVTPFEMIPVTFSGANTFCQGSSTNLSASSTIQGASATVFYNWYPSFGLNTTIGADVIANPTVSTNYTVTGHYGNCSNSGQITVGPNNLITPVITPFTTNTLSCFGDLTTLNASGADTYTWTNNVQTGVPFVIYNKTTYYVNGTDLNGCVGTSSITIDVNSTALFSISSDSPLLYSGQTTTLVINGNTGTTYSVNGLPTTMPNMFVITPTVTTTYTITSLSSTGCQFNSVFVQDVGTITNITSSSISEKHFNVFPNPSNGTFTVKSNTEETIQIINELGEIIKIVQLYPGANIEVTGLSAGIYSIHSSSHKFKICVTP